MPSTPASAVPNPPTDAAFQIQSVYNKTCAAPDGKTGTGPTGWLVGVACNSADARQRWTYDPTTQELRNQDPALAGRCLSLRWSNSRNPQYLVMDPCNTDSIFPDDKQRWTTNGGRMMAGSTISYSVEVAYSIGRREWMALDDNEARHDDFTFLPVAG